VCTLFLLPFTLSTALDPSPCPHTAPRGHTL
jgi:hypothetical protein